MPDREDRAGSVIVVGGGVTGIVAALELGRNGCDVLLLDRDAPERFGGQARESFGGIFVVDTPLQRRHGVHDSVGLAWSDWQRFGELTPAQVWPWRWAQAYVRDCRVQVYDWLRGMHVGFLPMPQWPERRGNSVPRWHIVWGTGHVLVDRLIEALQAQPRACGRARLQTRFGHRVERLLFEAGRVCGVAGVQEDDGAPFEHRGAAVLVASGGITGDSQLVRQHWPGAAGAPAHLLIGAHRYGDGRLHRASEALGAQVRDLDRMWNYAAGVRHWRPRQPDHGLSLVPPRSALWLDARGRRFDPPLLAGWDTSEAVARIAAQGGTSWQVLNRRIALREFAVSGAEFNPSIRERRPLAFLRETLLGNRWLVDTLMANCQDIVHAATPQALARRMNELAGGTQAAIAPAALLQALQEFDATIGTDDAGRADAQREHIRVARRWRGDRLRTASPGRILDPGGGPLIAIRESIISRKSLGGIVTDLGGRVLQEGDRPIAGLYAAGEAAGFGGGGMNGRRALEGTFLGGCIYSARRAAQAIVADARASGVPSGA